MFLFTVLMYMYTAYLGLSGIDTLYKLMCYLLAIYHPHISFMSISTSRAMQIGDGPL